MRALILLLLVGLGFEVKGATGTIFSNITRTNALSETNLFLTSTPVPSGTKTIYFSDLRTAVSTNLGAAKATTLDTGQGANELYDMDQDVLTTSSPTFDSIKISSGVNQFQLVSDPVRVPSLPVAVLRPVTTSQPSILDLMPNGMAPTNHLATGVAWIDILNRDLKLDTNNWGNWNVTRVSQLANGNAVIGAIAFGTNTPGTIQFQGSGFGINHYTAANAFDFSWMTGDANATYFQKHVRFITDNTWDIGAGGFRPRSLTVASNGIATVGVITATNGFSGMRSNLLAPSSLTFPATTVNWTNPLAVSIMVYIDNSGVTGTAIKKNGTQIFQLMSGPATLGLQSGEYFSQTYSVGTPTATYHPFP